MKESEIYEPIEQNHEKRGLTLNSLKYIAITAMLIDHTAHAFVPEGSWIYILMRFVGRITAPIMFYAAVEGYHHTKDIRKYLFRLALFALISYVPFALFLGQAQTIQDIRWHDQSVIYTIFLGVLAVHIRHRVKNPFIRWGLIVALGLLSFIGDWGEVGFIIILVFDFYYGNFSYQAFAYVLILLTEVGLLINLTGYLASWVYFGEKTFDAKLFMEYWFSQYGMFLPIFLLSFYNGEKGKSGMMTKWFFYIFYPLHLMVIWGIGRFFLWN